MAAPRSMTSEDGVRKVARSMSKDTHPAPSGNGSNSAVTRRRRRSVVVSDRKVRSADVGVSGLYEVISEADLAFSPDAKVEAVTVFQVSCVYVFRFSFVCSWSVDVFQVNSCFCQLIYFSWLNIASS